LSSFGWEIKWKQIEKEGSSGGGRKGL